MNPDSSPEHLTPERVEWIPSSPEQIEVRVSGTWKGPSVPPRTVLVIGALRVVGLGEPVAPPAWSARFHAPSEARAAIESGDAVLDVDGLLMALPTGAPGRLSGTAEEAEDEGGTLIDPAVLAERRARRAEQAEQSAAERAATAEQSAETLRAQLSNLEERLTRAAGERDALAARVADAERRLRLAEQREEAERRRRSELEGEAAAARRLAEDELRALRDQLASAVEVTEALERELHVARLRQEAAEAAAARVDARLREALDRVEELESGGAAGSDLAARQQVHALEARLAETEDRLRREAAVLSDRLSRVEAERAALGARLTDAEAEVKRLRGGAEIAEAARTRMQARVDEAEAAAAEARSQLDVTVAEAEELRRRLAAVPAASVSGGPATGREDALVRQVATLQADLAARASTQARVQQAIEVVRQELGEVRARVDASRTGSASLRSALAAAEARGVELEEALAEARATLADARTAITEARAESTGLRSALDAERATRQELDARVRALTDEVASLRVAREELEAELAAAPAPAPAAAAPAPAAAPPVEVASEPPAAADTAPSDPLPPTGDAAMDLLLSGLRDQIASAREQLAWETVLPPREEPVASPAPAPEPDPEPEPVAREDEPERRADDDTHVRLREIERDLRAALPTTDRAVPAREVISSLQEAAERLRAAAAAELSRVDGADEGEAEPGPVAAEPEPEPEPEPARPAEPAGTPVPARTPAIRRETPWLRTAIERLAASDPKTAADVIVAALPAQARLGQRLSYALSAPELGTVKVAVAPGDAPVEHDALDQPATRVTGSLAALAPLAAGGAPSWRPARALAVEGDRRAIRRLLKAQRSPVTLAQLGEAGPPEPRTLLAALAAAVDPAWTTGHRFGLRYVLTGDAPTELTVLVEDGRALRLAAPDEAGHAATVTVSATELHQLLAGTATGATVTGDERAMKALHAWFDRARGGSTG